MEISLPPAKWIKAVGRIAGTGTSGWDWLPNPARGGESSGWVKGTIKTNAGDLFLTYAVGADHTPEANRPTILWMAIPVRGSLVYIAEAASDTTWSLKLLGVTRSLLGMSANARVLFGLDRRLQELQRSQDRNPAAASAITEIMTKRQQYIQALERAGVATSDAAFIRAAFENFLIEQSSLLNKARDDLLLALQAQYKHLENVPPRQSQNRQPVPNAGRRNLQLRRTKNDQ